MQIRIAIIIGVISLMGTTASAVPYATPGGAVESGSWSSATWLVGGVDFDSLELFIKSDTGAGPFAPDGAESLNLPSWSATLVNENYVHLAGTLTQFIEFDLHFEGDLTETLSFDILFWTGGVGGTFTGGLNVVYQGSNSWGVFPSFTANNPYDRTVTSAIPEPSSALLFAAGALVFATKTSRRHRTR